MLGCNEDGVVREVKIIYKTSIQVLPNSPNSRLIGGRAAKGQQN
jgi:hypothetical protein